MDYISQTLLVTLSTGFVQVTILFILQNLYTYLYRSHRHVPKITFYTFTICTSILSIVVAVLMLLPTPPLVIQDNWSGVTAPTLFIDIAYIISNRGIYSRQHILFFGMHHGISLGLIIVLVIALKYGFMVVSIIPWCLLWNASSILFAMYGVLTTHNDMKNIVVLKYDMYVRYVLIMVAEHTWRTAIYPLLIFFNVDHLLAVYLGLGLAAILEIFELYAEIVTVRQLYKDMINIEDIEDIESRGEL